MDGHTKLNKIKILFNLGEGKSVDSAFWALRCSADAAQARRCSHNAVATAAPLSMIAMLDYYSDSPKVLIDFLSYHETIKAHSQKTVDEYFLDLRNFFRYLKQSRDRSLREQPWDEISIMDVDIAFIRAITLTEVYGYLTYLSRDRAQQPNSSRTGYGLSAATRARMWTTTTWATRWAGASPRASFPEGSSSAGPAWA